jgi:uncharacterized protein involved in type VI secretion and phage assembly
MSVDKFPGIYRATVVGNQDPEGLSRVKVHLAFLEAENEIWAECCIPVGQRYTNAIAVPYIGQAVWVIFAGGDVSRPVWIGSAITEVDNSPTSPR